MDLGHWVLKEGLSLDEEKTPFGFIYLITNLQTNKKYIGRKQCVKTIVRKPLKNQKRKRHFIVESDWKEYTGSCKELNDDIKKFGKSNFKFEIIEWCNSKFELKYKEIKLQLENDVILKDDYYNRIIDIKLVGPKSF